MPFNAPFNIRVHFRTAGKQETPLDVDTNVITGELLRGCVQYLQLDTKIDWAFHDQEQDKTLDLKKTLAENGVLTGHHLNIRHHAVPSPEAKPPDEVNIVREEKEVLQRCENGHFYDPQKHTHCPHCGVPSIDVPPVPRVKKPEPQSPEDPMLRTRPREQPFVRESRPTPGEDPPTRGLISRQAGIDPVVGWLVCIHGPDKGRDYRIRSENNPIGRAADMYICIEGDLSISRERHAVISFDPKTNSFTLSPGEGRGLVYHNGKALFTVQELQPYDQIMLGITTLLFIPLCGDKFKWEYDAD